MRNGKEKLIKPFGEGHLYKEENRVCPDFHLLFAVTFGLRKHVPPD